MPEQRRRFSPQFKAEAVQMVIETGKPIAVVARDLGIHDATLGNWVNAWRREHTLADRHAHQVAVLLIRGRHRAAAVRATDGPDRQDEPMRGRLNEAGSPRESRRDYWGVVLDAPDAVALARFYAELLGWEITKEEAGWATIAPPDGVAYLGFQTAAGYVPPVWPQAEGRQRMMAHLDFEVSDLEAAVSHALELGAREAGHQPQADVRVMLDPVGHPFCLYVG